MYLAEQMREPRARQIVVYDGVGRRSRRYERCVRDDTRKTIAWEAKEKSEGEAILYHTSGYP
jgi:hypothetical protein